MGPKKILLTDGVSDRAKTYLEGKGFSVTVMPTPKDDIVQKMTGFDGVVVRSATKITRNVMENMPGLKIIGRAGAGLDNIDVECAKERGIKIVNSPYAHAVSVAEHAFALLLAITKFIPAADTSMKAGKWLKKEYENNEVRGKILAILGFGHIGVELAKRAVAFGMDVIAYDVVKESLDMARKMGCKVIDDLDSLLAEADYISLHVPLNKHTTRMIDAKRLGKMKAGAIIINTSRGGVIDQAALVDCLKKRKIKGAALDVFETEPVAHGDPILALDNVVLTPHIASSTEENQVAAALVVAEDIAKFFTE